MANGHLSPNCGVVVAIAKILPAECRRVRSKLLYLAARQNILGVREKCPSEKNKNAKRGAHGFVAEALRPVGLSSFARKDFGLFGFVVDGDGKEVAGCAELALVEDPPTVILVDKLIAGLWCLIFGELVAFLFGGSVGELDYFGSFERWLSCHRGSRGEKCDEQREDSELPIVRKAFVHGMRGATPGILFSDRASGVKFFAP